METKENVSHMRCVVHQDQTVDRKRIAELKEAWMGTAIKDECTAELHGIQVDYWKGTEVGMLGGLGFKGAQTAEMDRIIRERWEQAASDEMQETRKTAVDWLDERKKARAPIVRRSGAGGVTGRTGDGKER